MRIMYVLLAAVFLISCAKTTKEDVADINLIEENNRAVYASESEVDSIKIEDDNKTADTKTKQVAKETYNTIKEGGFSIVGKTIQVDYNNMQATEQGVNGLWEYLYEKDFSTRLAHLENDKNIYVLYGNYDQPKGKMSVTLGYRVTKIADVPEGLYAKTLPVKDFLTYDISGQSSDYHGEGWQKLEAFMSTREKNAYDFEVYTLTDDFTGVKNAKLWVATK